MLKILDARNGKGVFTTSLIKKGSQVLVVKGVLNHFERLLEIDGDILNNSFRYSLNYYLSPGPKDKAYYVNHSCEPNVKVVKRKKELSLVATRDIAKGEEIVFDYSIIIAKDDIWVMKCNCGTSSCRKTIKRYDRMPKKVLNRYLKDKMIPSFIRKFE